MSLRAALLGCALGALATTACAAGTLDIAFADVAPGDPGCAAATFHGGQVIESGGFGLADVERGVPIRPDTVFNVGSISKQFTAFAILLLEQDGKISLEDPVTRYFPELSPAADAVTIRLLLHHLGGLRDYLDLGLLQQRPFDQPFTKAQTLALLARQPAGNAPPGLRYQYSNTGYFLLSAIVEKVSGHSLRAFSTERIFRPLGMTDTTIVDHYPTGIDRLARGYAPAKGKGWAIEEVVWEQTGDGQVHTTVRDLARWDANFDTGAAGGKPLIEKLTTVGTRDRLGSGYAMGLRVATYRGLPLVSHAGDWAGYGGHMMRFPGRVSIAVLCNRVDGRPVDRAKRIADGVLADAMTPWAPTPVLEDAAPGLADLRLVETGLYYDVASGDSFRIERSRATGLRVRRFDAAQAVRQAGTGFEIGDGYDRHQIRFYAASGDQPAQVATELHGQLARFAKVMPWTPALAPFEGAFVNTENAIPAGLSIERGSLVLSLAGSRTRLSPLMSGQFEGDHPIEGRILIRVDGDGVPKRFTLDSATLNGLVFERR